MIYDNLREANQARQVEWDASGEITLAYAGNELAGEVGELIQAAVSLSVFGNSDPIDWESVSQEIGDVIICVDLIGLRCGLTLDHKPELPSFGVPKDIMLDLAIDVGMVSNTIKKLERERMGLVGSHGSMEALTESLNAIIFSVHRLAECLAIPVNASVVQKFNLTSRRYGLKTEMKG